MPAKTVAVPLIPGPSEESAIRTAFLMSRSFDGHVVGLHAPVTHETSVTQEMVMSRAGLGLSGEQMREMQAEEDQEIAREAYEVRRDFFTVAEAMKAETVDHPPAPAGLSASFKDLNSGGAEELAAYCRIFDLVVVGQPKTDPHNIQRHLIQTILYTSGRPVLMAPETPPETVGETILIGWNGTLRSARATAISRQHIETAHKVGIVTVKSDHVHGPSAEDLAEYLAWHGITAELVEVESNGRHMGDVLLGAADSFGADLLVIGAYAHTPLREQLTRGVTNHILSHSHLPVLLAH